MRPTIAQYAGGTYRKLIGAGGSRVLSSSLALCLSISYAARLPAQVFGAAPSSTPAVEAGPPKALPVGSGAPSQQAAASHANASQRRTTGRGTTASRRSRANRASTGSRVRNGSTQTSAASGVIRIPRETAPPSAPAPLETNQQKAADNRLLQQQEARSAQEQTEQNQVVQQAQAQRAAQQNQVRVQDAPGPDQTGVVPASGPPVLPANNGRDIQDAPGPAQTIQQPTTVPPTQTAPTQTTAPNTSTPQ